MTVEVIKADIFSLQVDALAQGVNLINKGALDRDIAEFKKRFPDNHVQYMHEARSGIWPLGTCTAFLENNKLIYNLFIQMDAGGAAQRQHVIKSILWMRKNLRSRDESKPKRKPIVKSLAMPSVMGGEEVESIVRQVFADWWGLVYVVDTMDRDAPIGGEVGDVG